MAWALIERGAEKTAADSGLGMSRRRKCEDSEITPPPHKKITKHSKLPACRLASGGHFPVHMESRLTCILCRLKAKEESSSVEVGKTWIKCQFCNEPLCFTKERNCFLNFHVI